MGGNDDFDTTQDQELVDLLGDEGKQRQACVVVLAGSQMGQMFVLGPGSTSIGRAPDVDLIVDEAGVSRKHAEIIILSDDDVVLRDCGSTNGTMVNGDVIRNAAKPLADGDKIQIGATLLLKFSYQDKLDESFQRHLYDSAVRDGLTGCYNKRYLDDRLEQEWAAMERHESELSVVIMDIDHFKKINDSLGHPAGDAVLQAVATAIRQAQRREEVFARYGGEEFVMLCRETGLGAAEKCAERLRKLVQGTSVNWQGEEVRVTISLGVASTSHRPEEKPTDLLARADRWLYAAKQAGRNQWCSDGQHPEEGAE